MIKQTPAMTPQISNIQSSTIANIEFAKKQQWAITNYTALIYVGIFSLGRGLNTISTSEFATLIGLTWLTLICGSSLLIQIQRDTGRYRKRLENIHNHWLSNQERAILNIFPYKNYALRGLWFLATLIGATTIGAGIVTYSLWRSWIFGIGQAAQILL